MEAAKHHRERVFEYLVSQTGIDTHVVNLVGSSVREVLDENENDNGSQMKVQSGKYIIKP